MGNIIASITDPICALAPGVIFLNPEICPDIMDAPTMSPTFNPACPGVNAVSCPQGQILAQVTYDPAQCTGGGDGYDSLVYASDTWVTYDTSTAGSFEDIFAISSFTRTCQSPQEKPVDTFCLPYDAVSYGILAKICPLLVTDTSVDFENAFKFELLNGDEITADFFGAAPNSVDGALDVLCRYSVTQE